MSQVYLNGKFLPASEAMISVDDRGFLFADGVYEVTPAYRGRLFRLDRHLARMRDGLASLRIEEPLADFEEVHRELLARNGLEGKEVSIVYYQVTRGVAPRGHAFPNPPVAPTHYAFAKAFRRPPDEDWERGFGAVTVPDLRWHRLDIKSIALLPNVLAQQIAVDHGVKDAIFVREGRAMEGAHSNLFVVSGGRVVTPPADELILHGITREFVLELATGLGLPTEERPIPVEELFAAEEVFFTGTTTEVRPTIRVDERPIGEGRVGPVVRRLYAAFRAAVDPVG